LLRDLLRVESQQGRLAEERQKGARERGAIDREAALLQRLAESLGQDRPLRGLSLTPEDERTLGGWGLLSPKPLLAVVNCEEERAEWPLQTSLPQLSVRGKLEMEIAQLPEEAQDFRRDYGMPNRRWPGLGVAQTVMTGSPSSRSANRKSGPGCCPPGTVWRRQLIHRYGARFHPGGVILG
jgi:ribosome-binding ATPase YchF (GTP1/OBG family)